MTASQERIRVCHVITRLIVGGAQRNTVFSCALVDRERFDSLLITGSETGPEGDLFEEAEGLEVPIVRLPTLVRKVSPARDARALFSLRRLLRAHHPDIVHTHSSKAGALGRVAARLERMPSVVHTVHGWSFHGEMAGPARAAYVRAERAAARWTDRLVVVTTNDRVKGLAAGIGRPEQYTVIRSGIPLDPFLHPAADRAGARRALGLADDAPVVGTVGRLSTQKDPETFVQVERQVLDEVPDARFVIVGDGPLRDATERLATRLGLGDRLHLLGIRPDVPEILRAFDVFVLTSRWEGLPRVVLEAMASGLPVVASSVDGTAEVVRDGVNGLLVGAGDVGGFAAATVKLLQHPELRDRLADDGRTAVVREFGLDTMIRRLEELYIDLVQARPT